MIKREDLQNYVGQVLRVRWRQVIIIGEAAQVCEGYGIMDENLNVTAYSRRTRSRWLRPENYGTVWEAVSVQTDYQWTEPGREKE